MLVHVGQARRGLDRSGVTLVEGVERDLRAALAPVGADRAVADHPHDLTVLDDPLIDAVGVALDAESAIAQCGGRPGRPQIRRLGPV